MPDCLLSTPCLDLVKQEVGAVEMVLEEPILHLVMQGWEMGIVVLGEPTLPLSER